MKIALDIESNALINPTKVWVIATRDLVTGLQSIYRNVLDDENELRRFRRDVCECSLIVGHNILGYDYPVLRTLDIISNDLPIEIFLDTLIVSKLVDYPRKHHSVEDYGVEFGLEKINWHDYSKYSIELEKYCIRDVDITEKIYLKYKKYIDNPIHRISIDKEHRFQCIVNNIENKGFTLDTTLCTKLLNKVHSKLTSLDKDIAAAFPPRLKLIREVMPKETKYGTISLTSIPKDMRAQIADLTVGAPFSYCSWVDFNPSSHKQIINVLNEAGWSPVVKTDTHIDSERTLNKLKRIRNRTPAVDLELQTMYTHLKKLEVSGWKVNEENLMTLPASAPAPARTLATRILHEARRRTLTEWLSLVQEDGRVHGKFQGIGAWTHRMSHQKPNMANITNEFDLAGKVKLLGKELRQCWTVPKERLLVGVDAEGIQLRIFAHYINDPEFTDALVKGKKDDKTDPHSLNQRILGAVCKSRAASKRFIFALLLGAGIGKLAEILGCEQQSASDALARLTERYAGFQYLKDEVIPADAKRGYFTGLDGRKVRILGDSVGQRKHLCMSGYLQNGEAVVIKTAAIIAEPELIKLDSYYVDIIHDEYQVEVLNDFRIAKQVASILCEAIEEAGRTLSLLCPLAGSYWNDDHKEFTIGRNWWETH